MKKSRSLVVVSVLGAMSISPVVIAHEDGIPKANEAYWGDSHGHAWTDRHGHCIRTINWTQELSIPACEGMVAKAPEPAPVEPMAIPEPAMPKIVYKSVNFGAGALFDTNKADLKPEGRQQLDTLVNKLNTGLQVKHIDVIGHTDSRGSDAYNQSLSVKRAGMVKEYLVVKGIPANIISSTGRGETQPIADNETSAGRAENRRVEINIRATEKVQEM